MFNRDKFKRLVHYIIARAGGHPGFGAVKLNKVLWFSDARQFMLKGQPITGATYIRKEFGPVPQAISEIRKELEVEGAIRCFPPKFEYEGWRFESRLPADIGGFADDEIQVVNFWITEIDEKHTAQSISDESHDYGWDIARMGEELPYHAFLAERIREPVGEELEWAKEVARKLGGA